jgi:hypothetical protein
VNAPKAVPPSFQTGRVHGSSSARRISSRRIRSLPRSIRCSSPPFSNTMPVSPRAGNSTSKSVKLVTARSVRVRVS